MDRSGSSPDMVALLRERRKAALAAMGEAVLSASNERVPIDTGELRDSGSTVVVHDRVYVGYSAPHAVATHEDMTSHFEGGRQSKFLETALVESRTEVLRVAAEHLRFD